MAVANFSNDQIFSQLNSGRAWSGATITYSFPTGPIGTAAARRRAFPR